MENSIFLSYEPLFGFEAELLSSNCRLRLLEGLKGFAELVSLDRILYYQRHYKHN